ncbi:MAG: class B sortase [Clostridia bacterium]|nr:class B sortase [Clostridia bacterium]
MKEKRDYFIYSKNNEYPLDIPSKYADKITNVGKRRSGQSRGGKKSFNFMLLIRIAAFIVLVVAAYIFGKRIYEYTRDIKYSESQNQSIAIVAHAGAEIEERETPAYPQYEGKEVETGRFSYPKITDYERLAQFSDAYPDFVFWMYIENTYVNYPVVQAKDNDYYLRRNMDGEDNLSGTLFMDFRCERDTLKGHTIIYGHNNQNGTMFGPIKQYLSKKFFEEHPVFYTYTKDAVTMWKVFSAYETDTDNYYIQTYFPTTESYAEFLQKIKDDSFYDTGVNVTADDDIMTLSTCYLYTKVNGRFVVHAVKAGVTPLN